MQTLFNFNDGTILVLLITLIVWTLVWKGFALWKSAQSNQPYWFIALLIINTMGILEIVYLFVIARKKEKEMTTVENSEMPIV